MKINLTLYGIGEEFLSAFTPRERSRLIGDIVFSFLNQDKEKILEVLKKHKSRDEASRLLEEFTQRSNASSLQAKSQTKPKIQAHENPKPNPTKQDSYDEEGSVEMDFLKNEFSMTK